ncbi:MAG: hypothetical protein OXU20_32300 [Myxococcales bacterium]|nr:hypothetical protein [Myxococcales bacterium]
MKTLRHMAQLAVVAWALQGCSDGGEGELSVNNGTGGDPQSSAVENAPPAASVPAEPPLGDRGGSVRAPSDAPSAPTRRTDNARPQAEPDAPLGEAPPGEPDHADDPSDMPDGGLNRPDTVDATAPMDEDPLGPVDGDPTSPVVELDDVPCRNEGSSAGPQRNAINATIDGRQLVVDYPCGKHEGAHMTLVLNLHGTLIGGASFLYQRGYFPAYRLVHSHNLIVMTPQSVSRASLGAQWGNSDNDEDVPHLLALIDWAYTAFAKFQIRGLWIGGHSWGARFISGDQHPFGMPFACHPMLEDKVKGVIAMSRLRMPDCADRLSLISTRGEDEEIPLLDQSAPAATHGCDLPMQGPQSIGDNEFRHFQGCDPGWLHDDYHMLEKGHIDAMDDELVLHMIERIKATER